MSEVERYIKIKSLLVMSSRAGNQFAKLRPLIALDVTTAVGKRVEKSSENETLSNASKNPHSLKSCENQTGKS